jgi:hypothetical protein
MACAFDDGEGYEVRHVPFNVIFLSFFFQVLLCSRSKDPRNINNNQKKKKVLRLSNLYLRYFSTNILTLTLSVPLPSPSTHPVYPRPHAAGERGSGCTY